MIKMQAHTFAGMILEDEKLDTAARKVFVEVRRHTVMPYLEVAAVTGVRGDELKHVVNSLAQRGMVVISNPDNVFSSNVSISGSYF